MSDRNGDWMQTYTGAAFYPLDPKSEEIRFEDISSPLSKLCRYGGHTHKFYSIAEHCVHIAEHAPDPFKLTALMHDASEAYLQDIVRPVKPFLSNYIQIEHRLEAIIAQRFGLIWPFPSVIKELDIRICTDEREQAMARPPMAWRITGEPLGVTLKFWSPAQACYEFTTAFYRYGGKS